MDALQPVFDEDFNAAVSNIPATTFKDLVHQTLIQQHAGENSVGSNYENISRVSSYSDALAQSTMQSIQILVDQIAKGIWGMLGILLISHLSHSFVLKAAVISGFSRSLRVVTYILHSPYTFYFTLKC